MANLKTRNVFLDTEVFEAFNFDFQSTAFQELSRLARVDFVSIFLTTITIGEIRTHMAEKVRQATNILKAFRNREGRILQKVSKYSQLFQKPDRQECISEVLAGLNEFLDDAQVTVIDTTPVDAEAVFGDYFALRKPFGEGRNKSEFPDAFAQHALMKWCEKNGSKMYVISANQDWQGVTDRLIPLTKLEEFIDAAVKDHAEHLPEVVLSLLRRHKDKVLRAIGDEFSTATFYTDDVEGDVDGIGIHNIDIGKALILEITNASAKISLEVKIDYTADVSYLNPDYGREERMWTYRPRRQTEADGAEQFDAEIHAQYDQANEDYFEVSCEIDRAFGVTVLPLDYEAK